MKQTHYTYKLTHKNTSEYYIGSRTCNGSAYDDVSYMGSMVSWKVNKTHLIKEILNDDEKIIRRESKKEIFKVYQLKIKIYK